MHVLLNWTDDSSIICLPLDPDHVSNENSYFKNNLDEVMPVDACGEIELTLKQYIRYFKNENNVKKRKRKKKRKRCLKEILFECCWWLKYYKQNLKYR